MFRIRDTWGARGDEAVMEAYGDRNVWHDEACLTTWKSTNNPSPTFERRAFCRHDVWINPEVAWEIYLDHS